MTNVWLPPMNASDVMTKNALSVGHRIGAFRFPSCRPRKIAEQRVE
jgi:hypothetical protein